MRSATTQGVVVAPVLIAVTAAMSVTVTAIVARPSRHLQ